jgi:hypothetical protein
MNARRLSFEQVRDAWLIAAGELDQRMGGAAIPLFDMKNRRRTLYANIDREKVSPVLRMFDVANPDLSIPQRTETSVPQQALFALNHPFVAGRAIALSATSKSIPNLYQSLFQREPSEVEQKLAKQFLQSESICGIRPASNPDLWTYGYGELHPDTKRVILFKPLPHFSGTEWQGGTDYPDSKLGWLKLSAVGGHPGNDLKHVVIRRWTAIADGEYSVISRVTHEPKEGDGIRAFVIHSERGVLQSATIHSSSEQLNTNSLPIWKGDTIDFVVDIGNGLNSDQFLWDITISKRSLDQEGTFSQKVVSQSKSDFTIPSDPNLDRWQQLAQVLMLTNEFMFVD